MDEQQRMKGKLRRSKVVVNQLANEWLVSKEELKEGSQEYSAAYSEVVARMKEAMDDKLERFLQMQRSLQVML
jgi:predicted transcriptional regulator